MNPASIFVIVPAYNEQTTLRTAVLALLERGYKVVVVDDGSSINQEDGLKDLPIHFIRHPFNLGQGAALQTGNQYALEQGASVLVHFDADGQHLVEDISNLVAPLETGTIDIVLGTRFGNSVSQPIPLMKRMILQVARYFHFILTGLLLTDAHNGLRAMNRKAAEAIVLTENRMAHASEILLLIKKKALRYQEVPVQILYTGYSKQKGQSAWNSIRIFFDLLLHKLFE